MADASVIIDFNQQLILPLQNLREVEFFRVGDAEGLDGFVVFGSYIVGYVFVIVLCGAGVDVDYARRNLACLRVLEVCKVKR